MKRIRAKYPQALKPKAPEPRAASAAVLPGVRGNYWEDRVYQFAARRHKMAVQGNNAAEKERFNKLMQSLANHEVAGEAYTRLDAERRAFELEEKKKRKKNSRNINPMQRASETPQTSLDVLRLKKKIFNMQAKLENKIAAFDKLPRSEQEALAKRLPPYLFSQLEKHLRAKGLL